HLPALVGVLGEDVAEERALLGALRRRDPHVEGLVGHLLRDRDVARDRGRELLVDRPVRREEVAAALDEGRERLRLVALQRELLVALAVVDEDRRRREGRELLLRLVARPERVRHLQRVEDRLALVAVALDDEDVAGRDLLDVLGLAALADARDDVAAALGVALALLL